MKTVYIYTLRDPRNNKIRYVGKTIQKPQTRLRAHIRQAQRANKSHRDRWIMQVLADIERPVLEVIEEATEENWEEREMYWIAHYDNLTNETAGGEGLHGHKFSQEHRGKLGKSQLGNTKALGFKHTKETRAKGSANKMGKKNPNYGKSPSAETSRRMSASHEGLTHTQETKDKMAATAMGNQYAKGHKQTPEHKRNWAASMAKRKTRKAKEAGQASLFDSVEDGGSN